MAAFHRECWLNDYFILCFLHRDFVLTKSPMWSLSIPNCFHLRGGLEPLSYAGTAMLGSTSTTVKNFPLKRRLCFLLKLVCFVSSVLIFCEFLIYYVVIFQCRWPDVKGGAHMSEKETSASVLKAIILADTHLLGEIKGHWLDKLRR